jgi:signal transduction histidine kinase
MRQRWRWLSHALFAVIAAAALLVALRVNLAALREVGRGCTGLSLVEEGLVNPIGLGSWGAGAAGFRMWDRVIAVNGELVFSRSDIVREALAPPVGTAVTYQVLGSNGDERYINFPTRIFAAADLLRGHAGHALLGLVFVLIAVLLYGLRPASAEAWSFFLFFGSLGVTLCMIVDATLLWTMPASTHLLMPFLGTFGFVLTAVVTGTLWRGGGALFDGRPELGEPGFADNIKFSRRMVASIAVAMIISAALAIAMERSTTLRYPVVDKLLYVWLVLGTLAAFALLAISYWRGRSPRRRARLRQIIWAWPLGAGIPIANLFLALVVRAFELSLLWDAFLLLVPIATADAIVRHDLLQLNQTARRLVGGLTVAVAVGVLLGFVLWGAVQSLGISDAPVLVALAALLFATSTPITHRLQRSIEQMLNPTRYDAGKLVSSFSARASTATHLRDVAAQLKQIVTTTLAPTGMEVLRLDAAQQLVPVLVPGSPMPVSPLHQQLLERAEPFVFADDGDDETAAPVELYGAAIVVRLAVQNEAVGLLCIGESSSGRPYEAVDIALVSALAGPLAAALVSTGSYETVERLNRELEQRVDERTAELAKKNAELALLNERKDELVATISHDFRSPLTIIRQNVQTVLRDQSSMDSNDVRDFLLGIARQEDRLTSLCINLLDLAKLKQLRPTMIEIDVVSLARSIVDGYAGKATGVGISLVLHAPQPCSLRGDADRLGQLLQNLIDNALKFTPAGGRVDVEILSTSAAVEFSVADTGCGVPADALPRLFEPFYQVPRQSHVGQGSGLGLAIVKAVVDVHGGTLRVQSEEDRGTRITAVLPIS